MSSEFRKDVQTDRADVQIGGADVQTRIKLYKYINMKLRVFNTNYVDVSANVHIHLN